MSAALSAPVKRRFCTLKAGPGTSILTRNRTNRWFNESTVSPVGLFSGNDHSAQQRGLSLWPEVTGAYTHLLPSEPFLSSPHQLLWSDVLHRKK